ncbi:MULTISPECIES: cytochrome c biogenesis protein ResB [unclassified Gordonia (in: high G+C Gram-positive bacteria)]|uniref:cytochrome c biogenesis protein ResB n=1 Tax=unclassified Gordonia (in: high G+C Gram-positive bacteria) TaxID=2657482 RepID=UPI000F913B0D|nr:MAG: cytochrome c biogenesis protein ResB [Gordonia sp. (in: high G+C Gram-positive bacteria)]
MSGAVATRPPETPPQPPSRPSSLQRYLVAPTRNLWRSLTSMRTALALLFLLAVAAIPGALLPQRPLNAAKTQAYIDNHGRLGTIMDRLQLFDVFASSWFTAIYALLFVSLVGCLLPRMAEHLRSLRARPVPVPRNLARMPRHEEIVVDGDVDPEQLAQRIRGNLRGWRSTIYPPDQSKVGTYEVSAEKGYLREFGNLVFHFALLSLLIAVAVGKMWGYEGTRSLVADGEEGMCNTSTAVYDSFRAGRLVDGTDLQPFCIRVDDFTATFLPSGQPDMYTAMMRYTEGAPTTDPGTWPLARVRVNEPLRLAGSRVYVLGNGFAPTFTVTFPDGQKRTQTVPFAPDEMQTMLSSGAVRVDPPAGMFPVEKDRRRNQIGIEGIFAPTAKFDGTLLSSSSPIPKDPYVAIRVYRGDTGLDSGRPQNAYALDTALMHSGQLRRVGQANLKPGRVLHLDNGTTVTFDGYQRWVSIQVSNDPAQLWVLVSAVVMLLGLLVSLLVKRRRVWARIRVLDDGPDGQRRTVVTVAGLARTDSAGWGDGFSEQARELVLGADGSR